MNKNIYELLISLRELENGDITANTEERTKLYEELKKVEEKLKNDGIEYDEQLPLFILKERTK